MGIARFEPYWTWFCPYKNMWLILTTALHYHIVISGIIFHIRFQTHAWCLWHINECNSCFSRKICLVVERFPALISSHDIDHHLISTFTCLLLHKQRTQINHILWKMPKIQLKFHTLSLFFSDKMDEFRWPLPIFSIEESKTSSNFHVYPFSVGQFVTENQTHGVKMYDNIICITKPFS